MSAYEVLATVVSSVFLSIIGSGVVLRFAGAAMKDRWLKGGEAKYDRELEALKVQLERGSYVTKAQYDLELSSYRELWSSMALLRIHARALLIPRKVHIIDLDGTKKHAQIGQKLLHDFFESHNAAVRGIEAAAPFYQIEIKQIARLTSESCMDVINYLGDFSQPREDDDWYAGLEVYCGRISKDVGELESLIRERLSNLRVMPA